MDPRARAGAVLSFLKNTKGAVFTDVLTKISLIQQLRRRIEALNNKIALMQESEENVGVI